MATNTYQRPTPTDLLARIQADLEGAVSGISAKLRLRFERALAVAHAGVAHGLHGHISWAARQVLPDTAEPGAVLRFANIFLQPEPQKSATPAKGSASVTGSGGDLTAGTEIVRPSDGRLYTVDATLSSITTAQTVNYTAVDAGADGTIETGDILQLNSPVPDVDSVLAAAASTTIGTDLEAIESVLERLLDEFEKPARGGAPGDHVKWARQIAGVTRAWEFTHQTHPSNVALGHTDLFFVLDDKPGTVIPDAGEIEAVRSYVQALSGSLVSVYAPTEDDYVCSLQLDPLSASSAVRAELADMFKRDASPGGTILLSRVNEAISIASGELDHVVTSPAADKVHAYGVLPKYADPSITAL